MIGLFIGHLYAFITLFSGEYICRLEGIWNRPIRLIVGLVVGTLLGGLTWYLYHVFWLFVPDKAPLYMLFGGFGLSIGLVLQAVIQLKGWVGFLISFIAIFSTIAFTYDIPSNLDFENYLIAFNADATLPWWAITAIFPFFFALGGHAQALTQDIRVY